MTISNTSVRTAIAAIAAAIVGGCLLVTLVFPLIRPTDFNQEAHNLTNWIFWGLLIGIWLVIGGAGFLLRPYNRPRAIGLLLAAGILPVLFGFYYFILALLRTI